MRIASAFVLTAVLSLMMLSCTSQQVDMTALKKTVDEFNTLTKEAMLAGKIDSAAIAFYQEDAMEMAPNMAMVKGRDSIMAMQEQMMKEGMKFTDVNFTTTDLQAAGTIAYEIGTYDMSLTMPPMGDIKDHGKYVTIWHQQPDGTWKVRAEIWNTDTPMPPPKEEMKKK
jgi:ketosteroid isomerase-like protein